MHNILITGVASGLGQEFRRQYREYHPEATIYALDRHVPKVLDTDERTKYIQFDLTDEEAVLDFRTRLEREQVRLDLVVHCAGIRGLEPSIDLQNQRDVQKAEEISVVTKKTMLQTFDLNCVSTFVLLRALLPSLLHGGANEGTPGAMSKAKVIVMGSRMGSITSNISQGKGYAYRASKAALNAIIKSFSLDIPEVIWTIIHPGRVATGLVAIRENGALPVDEAVAGMLRLIDRVDDGQSGHFLDRFGVEMPW